MPLSSRFDTVMDAGRKVGEMTGSNLSFSPRPPSPLNFQPFSRFRISSSLAHSQALSPVSDIMHSSSVSVQSQQPKGPFHSVAQQHHSKSTLRRSKSSPYDVKSYSLIINTLSPYSDPIPTLSHHSRFSSALSRITSLPPPVPLFSSRSAKLTSPSPSV